tara:strand:- start:1029 stop:1265 length:237 start_codon:yes stop_codon:yes gene_type:complete
MDALLKALKEAFKDTNIHEEDFILECVESVITTNRYGSTYDFNELPCVDSVEDIRMGGGHQCKGELLDKVKEAVEGHY